MQEISYLTLAVTSFIFSITPGPGVMAVLATSIRRGLPSGLLMTLGEVTGDMIYLFIAIFSLAGLEANFSNALLVVRILGAGYLVWLGIQTFRQPPLTQGTAPSTPSTLALAFSAGFMISATNPKVIIFYLSFLPLFIDLASLNFADGAMVMAVMAPSVYAGPALIALLGNKAARLATGARSGRIMNRITGILLIAVAIALVITV